MPCRGVRGATTADANTREDILRATRELLALMIRQNGIRAEDVASAFFSTTPDLDAEFPALAARQMGWYDVALLCNHELDVPGSFAAAFASFCTGIRTPPPEILSTSISRTLPTCDPTARSCPRSIGTNWKAGSSSDWRIRKRGSRVRDLSDYSPDFCRYLPQDKGAEGQEIGIIGAAELTALLPLQQFTKPCRLFLAQAGHKLRRECPQQFLRRQAP